MTRIYEDANGLRVSCLDDRMDDEGCACWGYEYEVSGSGHGPLFTRLEFQRGPVPEKGVNGLTNEAVIAVVIHRLGVLNEKLPCEQNELAIGNLRTALAVLESRTADRVARGVEGKEEA